MSERCFMMALTAKDEGGGIIYANDVFTTDGYVTVELLMKMKSKWCEFAATKGIRIEPRSVIVLGLIPIEA